MKFWQGLDPHPPILQKLAKSYKIKTKLKIGKNVQNLQSPKTYIVLLLLQLYNRFPAFHNFPDEATKHKYKNKSKTKLLVHALDILALEHIFIC